MTKLTAQAVRDILRDCLCVSTKPTAIRVQGIVMNYCFDPDRLSNRREEIIQLLNELPETFRESGGGGWSFLMSCKDKHENHWGEHPSMEELMCLGIAIDKVVFAIPREMWQILPGGMPYFIIKD